MKKRKNYYSFFGAFNYFEKIVGIHLYGYIFINFIVGLLDGLGLALFIPLLTVATGGNENSKSLGKLQFIVDSFNKLGLQINLLNILLLMVALFVLKAIISYIRVLYFIKIRLKTGKEKRFSMINGLRNLSYPGFTKLDSGKIQNTMVGETGKLVTAMVQYFNSIQHIVMLITYSVLATLSNWKFAVMVGIGALLTNFLYRYIYKVTKERARELSFVGHDFNGNLIQAIHNFKYLKATNYFSTYIKKLRDNILKSEKISYKISSIGAIAEATREPIIIIIIAIVILIQVQYMGNNFSSIMVSLLMFYRSLSHLVTMQNSWNGFVGSSAGLESVENLINEFNLSKETQNSDTISSIDNITIENISLSFGTQKILNDISFIIKNKTSVAFVGESGAGKTTLANVICGLQLPDKGKIVTDKKSIYETQLNFYRNKIGYITQEPVIFNDTMFNNVTFWAEKTPENLLKFWNTLELVSIRNFAENLEKKEDTPLGNNGILISGGQKQRISIARELYKNVELLIMDEATSALDSETEKFIKDNIDALHGKFTMIIIAHRLSTIKNVDVIYLMENGRITDFGNFEELCNKSANFKRMVDLQMVNS